MNLQERWDLEEKTRAELARMAPQEIKKLKESLEKWCRILEDGKNDQ